MFVDRVARRAPAISRGLSADPRETAAGTYYSAAPALLARPAAAEAILASAETSSATPEAATIRGLSAEQTV